MPFGTRRAGFRFESFSHSVASADAGGGGTGITLTGARRSGYSAGMITLARGRDTVQLTLLLWESLQIFAKQAGWEPAGAVGIQDRGRHSVYAPGCTVEVNDARHLAAALERFVNGEAADSGELDLAALARLINFLRGGAVEIR